MTAVRGAETEEPRLGSAVGSQVRVIVQVILAEVGERDGGEAHAGDPLLVQGVGRHFGHDVGGTLVGQLPQLPVES